MKNLTALLSLLFLALQTTQDCCASGCLDGSKSVNIGETVETIPKDTASTFPDTQLCGTVFKAKGSCCQYAKMQSYANKTLTRLKIAFNTMNAAAGQISSVVSNFKLINNTFHEKSIYSVNRDPYFEDALGGPENWQKIKGIWDHLGRTADDLLSKVSASKYNATKCYETMANQKLNALCMACSGDASNFYDSNAKRFKVKSTYCKSLVDGCATTLDVFSKVVHMLHSIYAFTQSLASKAPAYNISDSISLHRLLVFDRCGNDTVGCKADSSKLTNFCKEIGFLTDFSIGKIVNSTTINAVTVKTEASAQFVSVYEEEGTKMNSEQTTLQAIIDSLKGTSNSIQTKMSTLTTSITNAATSWTAYIASNTTYVGNTASSIFKANLASSATDLMTKRDLVYTPIQEICTLMITYISEDLLTRNKTSYLSKNPFLIQIKRLKSYTDEAASQRTAFNTYLATFSALTAPVTTDQNNQLNLKMWNQTAMHDIVVTQLNAVRTSITTFTDEVHTEFTAFKTVIVTPVKNAASQRKNRVTPYNNLLAAKSAYTVSVENYNLAVVRKEVFTTLNAKLSTSNATTQLSYQQNTYNSLKSRLETLVNNLNSAVAASTSMTGSTFFSQSYMQPSTVDGAINDLAAWRSSLNATQNTGDGVISNLTAEFNTAQAAANTAAQKASMAQSLKNNAEYLLWATVQPQQAALKESLKTKAELTTIMNDINLIKSQMVTLDTNYGNSEAVILSPKIKCVESKKYADGKGLTSESSVCSTLSSSADTQWASAQSEYTQSSSSLQNQWTAKESEYNTKNTDFLSKNTTTTTHSTNLWLYQSYIEGNSTTAATERATVDFQTKRAALFKEALTNYTAAIQQATSSQLSMQLVFVEECHAVCNGLKSVLTSIAGATSSAPSNFKSTLQHELSQVNNLLTRVNTLKTQTDTIASQVSSSLSSLTTVTATRMAEATTNATNLGTTMTNDNNTMIAAESTYTSTGARRLLQTYDDTTDFLIDDSAGCDTDSFKNGITLNTDLSSTVGYQNSPDAPVTTTSTSTQQRSEVIKCLGVLFIGLVSFFISN